jgi:serine/threonine-protein kinase
MKDDRSKAMTMAAPASDSLVAAPVSGDVPAASEITLERSPPEEKPPDPYLGKTIDARYVVEDVLGEGGMGVVYRGRHELIDKRVAIKILRGEMARDKEITERFLMEAKAASAIGNPHIVEIYDFGKVPDGATYFVMEYLDGVSLGTVMTDLKVIPPVRLVHIAKQIAKGLDAAHEAGIVHRDLKPDNVMLVRRGDDKDFVKILDFGIAKVGGDASRLTRAGSVFGTPHYMSPEQAAGVAVDRRTDIYSLGVILYEMAAGKVPFDADNFMGILTQHMYKAPAPIRALVPVPQDVPPGLEAIILKCLSKKVEARYQSMRELVEDLEKLEKGLVPDAVPEMMTRSGSFNVPADYFRTRGPMPTPFPMTPMARFRRSKLGVSLLAASLSLVALVALVLAIRDKGQPTVSASTAETIAMPAVAPTPTAAAAATPATQDVKLFDVVVNVEPRDARIKRDGDDLGTSPVKIALAPGQKATLVISAPKYFEKVEIIDDQKAERLVKLKPIPAGYVAPPSKPTPKPTSTTPPPAMSKGSKDEFQDPWKKK